MADTKISGFTDGSPRLLTDELPISRSGANYKLPASSLSPIGLTELIYRYTVAGSDKASIDTGADTADAGTGVWTGGDLLEVWMIMRTDEVGSAINVDITVNNDSSSIYDQIRNSVQNATVTGGNVVSQAKWLPQAHGSGGSASYPAVIRISIPGYAGTTFNKVGDMTIGSPDATAANNFTGVYGIGYRSTSAITRMKVTAESTNKLKVGSQLLIYKRRST